MLIIFILLGCLAIACSQWEALYIKQKQKEEKEKAWQARMAREREEIKRIARIRNSRGFHKDLYTQIPRV